VASIGTLSEAIERSFIEQWQIRHRDAPTGGKTGWPVAHPVLLNNGLPPVYMSCNTVPTSSTSPTPTYADHGINFSYYYISFNFNKDVYLYVMRLDCILASKVLAYSVFYWVKFLFG
uniref:WS_DGAT_C domain-containing protein n=1 Tax=Ascaris lumbricoides TaxID=6252 RepID=A0A0M3HM38_ASCLU